MVDFIGAWSLQSRIDRTADGRVHPDPILGSDPVAMLVYTGTHFTAQFMKRDRSATVLSAPASAGQNNTSAIGGYDAYFGTWKIDPATGQVAHTLLASINPDNIGLTVYRTLEVHGSQLVISLATTSHDGTTVTRTLTWDRMA